MEALLRELVEDSTSSPSSSRMMGTCLTLTGPPLVTRLSFLLLGEREAGEQGREDRSVTSL